MRRRSSVKFPLRCSMLAVTVGLLVLSPLGAQTVTVHSTSDQFIVSGQQADGRSLLTRLRESNTNAVTMEPSLLAVSCERIKQALLLELDLKDQWRGQVYLMQQRTWPSSALCSLRAERFKDNWIYRLELPETVEPPRLVETITQVLLLEMANRGSSGRSARLPLWLAEGMPRYLALSSDLELVVIPPAPDNSPLPVARISLNQRLHEDLRIARDAFARGSPISVQELSWPGDELLNGSGRAVYRENAKWFIYELLHTKGGREPFREFIADLPGYLNWQTAFFAAYKPIFEKPLDVEKWWALRLTAFNPKVAPLPVALDSSLAKLDEVLRTPVQVRVESGDLPLRTEVSLQSALKEADPRQQVQLLQEVIIRLQLVRPRLAAQHIELVDGYLQALGSCFTSMREQETAARPGVSIKRSDGPPAKTSGDHLEELITALDKLDARRNALASPSMAQSPGPTERNP